MKNTRHLQVWFCVSDVLRIQNQTVTLGAEAGIPKITLIHSKRQGPADTSFVFKQESQFCLSKPLQSFLIWLMTTYPTAFFIKGNNLT